MSKKRMFFILLICIGSIILGFLNRFIGLLLSNDRTELYSHVSQERYEVKVYQIGYTLLTNRYHLLIQVNREDIVEFVTYSQADTRLYPVQDICCEKDNGNEYRIAFLGYQRNADFEYFTFNADFSGCVTSCAEFHKLSDHVYVNGEWE